MDEIANRIYNFILKNENCNQNAIRESKICASKTAIKKVNGLVENGYVEDLQTGKNGFHKYRVNDKIKFTRLSKELETIETRAKIMEKPLLKIAELQDRLGPAFIAGYYGQFVVPYRELTFTMLFRLLKISSVGIRKEDSFRLQARIVSLIAKATKQPFYEYEYKKIISQNKTRFNEFIRNQSVTGASKLVFGIEELKEVKNFAKEVDRFESKFG